MSKEMIDRFKSRCFSFIWAGRTEQNKRAVLYNTYEEGGIGLTHIGT